MHFFKSLIVGASALAALVAAQSDLKFTKAPTNAQAGQSYPLTWTGGDSTQPVTILLREGSSTDLKTVSTITSTATGGSFTWKVPSDIASGAAYALEIQQGSSTPNYWNVGSIAGGTGTSASASASSAVSSASSAISSAASSVSSELSSVASSLSSKLSSVTASSSSASVTGSSSSRNSTTISKASLSTTKSSTKSGSSSSASGSSSPSSTGGSSSSSSAGAAAPSQSAPGAAAGLKSNAALVLGAVAAMAYLG